MPVPAEYAILVDAAKWQPGVDYAAWKRGGVEALIAKASMGLSPHDIQLLNHHAGARAQGMHFGVYHWADPTQPDEQQMNNFCEAADKINWDFDFVAVDVEQYWRDWKEYQNGHITKFLTPQEIDDNAWYMVNNIAKVTQKPTLIYTRAWFILEYCKQLTDWIFQWPIWWAQYVYDQSDVILTWDSLIANWLPKVKNPAFPTVKKGWTYPKDWVAWQWTGDKFILPGCKTCLDVNYVKRSFLGEPLPPPVPHEIENVTVTTSSLNIRNAPMGQIIGSTSLGKQFKVEETIADAAGNSWYKVVAFIASKYTKES